MSRRVAIVIDLEQPYPWHHETFSGVADHARKRGWRVDAMAFGAQLIAASRGGIRHDDPRRHEVQSLPLLASWCGPGD